MKEYYGLNIIEWSIFIFTIILSLYYAIIQLFSPDLNKYINKFSSTLTWIGIHDFFNEIDNGDLIFISGNTSGEKTCKWFTNCFFSHVGFLFREKHPSTKESIVYVLECDVGQDSRKGCRILRLENKLKKYRGCKVLGWKKLFIKERPKTNDILNLFNIIEDKKVDSYILGWWLSSFPKILEKINNPNTVFCSEVVAFILQQLNILKKNKIPAWYSPKGLVEAKYTEKHCDYSFMKYIDFTNINEIQINA